MIDAGPEPTSSLVSSLLASLLLSLADVLLLVDRDCVGLLASVATAADFAGLVPPPQATTESPPRINTAATRA